ncbi:MAG: hypothetical protein JWO38_7054 [Gemmataceae bacterium]|nr:hypothetical protein [Gemmataceae bacterium]
MDNPDNDLWEHVSSGESHATLSLYHHLTRPPAARCPALPTPPAAPRPRPEMPGPRPVRRPLLRRRPDRVDRHGLYRDPRRPVRPGRVQHPARHLARHPRTREPDQPGLGRRPAPGAAATTAATGRRPGPGPVPRPTLPDGGRGVPGPAQGRDHPLPRLRHPVRRPPRPAVHPGGDVRVQGGGGRPRPPAVASAGGQDRGPPQPPPAGPRVLHRERDPVPASRPGPVPDAGGDPRAEGGPPPRAEWDPGVPAPADQRVGPAHPDERGRPDGHGLDLREVPQLPGAMGEAGPEEVGVRVLGAEAVVICLGGGNLPPAVRDRVERPADAPGPDPDLHPAAGPPDAVRGGRADPAGRVGVAPLGGVSRETARGAAGRHEPAAVPRDAGLAPAPGGKSAGVYATSFTPNVP